jgi:hypothetical protein
METMSFPSGWAHLRGFVDPPQRPIEEVIPVRIRAGEDLSLI